MNKQLQRLYEIAKKEERKIIGLMSGTSLDGLDIALCSVSGSGTDTSIKLLQFTTIAYEDKVRSSIREIFAKKDAPLEKVCIMNKWLGSFFAGKVNQQLKEWRCLKEEIDLIASHGQTIFHAPHYASNVFPCSHSTLQIADGDQIAHQTGIITLCDFRQKHIAAGGEGAPLSAYGDYLMYGNSQQNCLLVNIGGISNYTFLPARAPFDQMTTGDAGPGNTLMNGWMEKNYGIAYDAEGAVAATGSCHLPLLDQMKSHPFFQQKTVASTGPESFSADWLSDCINKTNEKIAAEDVMATLNQFTAESIVHAVSIYLKPEKPTRIILSGGGIHNPVLMQNLQKLLQRSSSKIEISMAENADAKEAMIFALLANEAVAGNAINSFGTGNNHSPAVSFGKICLPG